MEYVTQLAHIVRVCLVVDGVAILMAMMVGEFCGDDRGEVQTAVFVLALAVVVVSVFVVAGAVSR